MIGSRPMATFSAERGGDYEDERPTFSPISAAVWWSETESAILFRNVRADSSRGRRLLYQFARSFQSWMPSSSSRGRMS